MFDDMPHDPDHPSFCQCHGGVGSKSLRKTFHVGIMVKLLLVVMILVPIYHANKLIGLLTWAPHTHKQRS